VAEQDVHNGFEPKIKMLKKFCINPRKEKSTDEA
jgi:hypothetical protein